MIKQHAFAYHSIYSFISCRGLQPDLCKGSHHGVGSVCSHRRSEAHSAKHSKASLTARAVGLMSFLTSKQFSAF